MSFVEQYYTRALETAVKEACDTSDIGPALEIADKILTRGVIPAVNSRGMLVQMVADRATLYAGYDLVVERDPYQPIRDELVRRGECSPEDVNRHMEGILLSFGMQYGYLDERQWDRVRDAVVRDNLRNAEELLAGIQRVSLPPTSDTSRRLSRFAHDTTRGRYSKTGCAP